MSVDINDLKNLPIAEKLRLVEILWDDISTSSEPIALHPWQFEEAGRRREELKAKGSLAIDRDELWRRIDG